MNIIKLITENFQRGFPPPLKPCYSVDICTICLYNRKNHGWRWGYLLTGTNKIIAPVVYLLKFPVPFLLFQKWWYLHTAYRLIYRL